MAQIPGGYNADQEIPDDPTLPDGHYPFEIADSEYCSGAKEGSFYIKLVFDGVKGSRSEGCRIWQNYTHQNNNPTAVRLGHKAFKELCDAVGLAGVVTDTSQLHGRRVMGEIYTEKGTGGYADKNQFSGYLSANSAGATGAPPPPAAPYVPPAAAPAQAPYVPPAATPAAATPAAQPGTSYTHPASPATPAYAPPVGGIPAAPPAAAPPYQPPPAPGYQQPAAAPPQQPAPLAPPAGAPAPPQPGAPAPWQQGQ
jgi:hypothetical protein